MAWQGCMRFALSGCGLLALLTGLAGPAQGEAPAGIRLEDGEAARILSWVGTGALLILAETKDGYGLRSIDLGSGEIRILSAPRSFTTLRPTQDTVHFSISPRGRWVVATEAPAEHAEIRVWRVQGDRIEDVPLRLPQDIIAGEVAWGETENDLLIAAAPYLYPEQEFSLLRLDLAKGELSGLVIKGNIDNITQLAITPGSGRLAVVCGGFRGEYPQQPVAVRLDSRSGGMELLHSECMGMTLRALGDGSILLSRDGALGRKGEAWVLPAGEASLVAAQLECSAEARISSTPDGSWLGWLEAAESGSGTLFLQRIADAFLLEGPAACFAFSFSPDGSLVAAAVDGGAGIKLMRLMPGD